MPFDSTGKCLLRLAVAFAFAFNTAGFYPVHAESLALPQPGAMVHLSAAFNPPMLLGLKLHPENPFRFDFIVDKGDPSRPEQSEGPLKEQPKAGSSIKDPSPLVQDDNDGSIKDPSASLPQDDYMRLIKYFLASLTIPEKDLWVNLSPYEKDRIVPDAFGQTEMGRDLLAQDYLLKQLTASLLYPEGETGKQFWNKVYAEAAKKYGTTQVPVNTFNKVWIMPDKAVVYENAKAGTVYVVESKLKVMLEQDYLALSKNVIPAKAGIHSKMDARQKHSGMTDELASQILRDLVIPQLTKEVNEGRNFAQLRQVYNSLILANWYKKKIKDSILAQVYADKNKVEGVRYEISVIPERFSRESSFKNGPPIKAFGGDIGRDDADVIYHRYLEAFKKGAYNYIKEEADPATRQPVPRKYFSGGAFFGRVDLAMTTDDQTLQLLRDPQNDILVETDIVSVDNPNALIEAKLTNPQKILKALDEAREPVGVKALSALTGLPSTTIRPLIYKIKDIKDHRMLSLRPAIRPSDDQSRAIRQRLSQLVHAGPHTISQLADLTEIGWDGVDWYLRALDLRRHPNVLEERAGSSSREIQARRARLREWLDAEAYTIAELAHKADASDSEVRHDLSLSGLYQHDNLIILKGRRTTAQEFTFMDYAIEQAGILEKQRPSFSIHSKIERLLVRITYHNQPIFSAQEAAGYAREPQLREKLREKIGAMVRKDIAGRKLVRMLAEVMKARGMTQADFARKLNWGDDQLSQVMTAKQVLRIDTLWHMLQRLGVPQGKRMPYIRQREIEEGHFPLVVRGSLGSVLKWERLAKGLPVALLAQRAYIPPQALYQYEEGKIPQDGILIRLGKQLGLDVTLFLKGDGTASMPDPEEAHEEGGPRISIRVAGVTHYVHAGNVVKALAEWRDREEIMGREARAGKVYGSLIGPLRGGLIKISINDQPVTNGKRKVLMEGDHVELGNPVPGDRAMNVDGDPGSPKEGRDKRGGIDLTAENWTVSVHNKGQLMPFHIDPAMLLRLQNAPGFEPHIIDIRPLPADPDALKTFLKS